jgi:hypothetical protein
VLHDVAGGAAENHLPQPVPGEGSLTHIEIGASIWAVLKAQKSRKDGAARQD